MEKVADERSVDCVFTILQKCQKKEKEWIRSLSIVFENCKIISSSDRKKIETYIDTDLLEKAFESIRNSAKNRTLKRKYFCKACKDKEFPCDGTVTTVIEALISKEVTNGVVWLVRSWDELLNEERMVLDFAASKWPDKDWTNLDSVAPWLLYVVSHCSTDTESDKIDVHLEELRELLTSDSQEKRDEEFDSGTFERVSATDAIAGRVIFGADSDVRRNVSYVVQQYLKEEKENLKQLLVLLKSRDLIASGKENEIAQSPIDDNYEALAAAIVNGIIDHTKDEWKERLSSLKEIETSFLKEFVSMVILVMTHEITTDDSDWLFHSWDLLRNFQHQLTVFIEKSWPADHKNLLSKWPWCVMETVLRNQKDDRVRQFIQAVICIQVGNTPEIAPILASKEPDQGNVKAASIDTAKAQVARQRLENVTWLETSFLLVAKLEEESLMTLQNKWQRYIPFIKEKEWSGLIEELQNSTDDCVVDFITDVRELCQFIKVPIAHSPPVEPPKESETPGEQEGSSSIQAGKNLASLKEWIRNSQQDIGNAYQELKDVAACSWPNDPSVASQDGWPFLLMAKCISENNSEVLTKFVSSVQEQLKNALHSQEVPVKRSQELLLLRAEESNRKDSQRNKQWFEDSFEFLSESFNDVKDDVSSIWPDEEELIDEEEWPMSLTSVFKNPLQAASVEQFIQNVESKQQSKKDEEGEAAAQKMLKENRQWMKKNFSRMKSQPELVIPLLKRVWPVDEILHGDRWAFNILTKCSTGIAKEVNTFVSNLKDILKEKQAEELPQIPKTQMESPKTEIDEARKELKQNIKWIKASFSAMKREAEFVHPLLRTVWPKDEKLYGSNWASEVLSKCESGNPTDVNTFVDLVKPMLEEKKRMQEGAQKAGKTESTNDVPSSSAMSSNGHETSQESIKWIEQAMPEIVDNYDIVLPVVRGVWPNDTSPPDKEHLRQMILEKLTLDTSKVQTLASCLKEKLRQERRLEPTNKALSNSKEQDTTESGSGQKSQDKSGLLEGYKAWITANVQMITTFREAVSSTCETIWGRQKWMSENVEWPGEFLATVEKEQDAAGLAKLVAKLRLLVAEKVAHTDSKQQETHPEPEQRKEPSLKERIDEGIEWLQRSWKDLKFYKYNVEPVVEKQWPGKKCLLTDELWPMELIGHCRLAKNKSPELTLTFLTKIKSMIEMLRKQFGKTEKEALHHHRSDPIAPDYIQIEFRVLLSTSKMDRNLYLWRKEMNTYTTSKLHFDKGRNCYTTTLVRQKAFQYLEYKYCCSTPYMKDWEKLPGSYINNRICNFHEKNILDGQRIIMYDIVTFDDYYVNLMQAWEHLPSIEKTQIAEIVDDIHLWIHHMKRGWMTSERHNSILNQKNFDKCLYKWIDEKMRGVDTETAVIVALALIDSIRCHNHSICDKLLLSRILWLLNTETLSKVELEQLYRKVVNVIISSTVRPRADIPDSILLVLHQLEKLPDSEFIFTLPIYWLVVNGGEVREKIPEIKTGSILAKKSCLPSARDLDWNFVKQKFEDDTYQSSFMSIADRIVKVQQIHPWIVKAFEYMLTPTTTLNLIQHHHDLRDHFGIEKVLLCMKRKIGTTELENLNIWKTFLAEFFENMRNTENTLARNLDIEFMCKQVLETIRSCNNFDKQTDRNNKTVIFALQVASEIIWSALIADEKVNVPALTVRPDFFVAVKDFVMKRIGSCPTTKDQMKHWNDLYAIEWHDQTLNGQWQALITTSIQTQLAKEWHDKDDDFVRFFAELLQDFNFNDELDKIFRSKVEECFKILLLCREKKWSLENWLSGILSNIPGTKQSILKLYDDFILRQVRSQTPLEFILKWPHTLDIFKAYHKKGFKDFSQITRTIIANYIRVFDSAVESMISGEILIEQLQMIVDNQDQCIELCRLLFKGHKKEITDVVKRRSAQMNAYEGKRMSIMIFRAACSYLAEAQVYVDLGELIQRYDQDVSRMPLSEVVESGSGDDKVIFFTSMTSHMKEIDEIATLKNNRVFLRYWLLEIPSAKSGWQDTPENEKVKIDWEIVVEDLWKKVKSSILELSSGIASGKVEITLLNELLCGCDESEITTVISQISNFHDLCTSSTAQSVKGKLNEILKVLKFKTVLDIACNLQALKSKHQSDSVIHELQFLPNAERQKSLSLNDIATIHLPGSLNDVTREEAMILSDFLAQDELLSWLLENTKGIDDVQVLCDLAMISAGENQMELDRVSAFHTTVPAFSPLIFDFDREIVINDLLKRCRQVFQKCRQDATLMSKWKSVGANIQWMKQTESFYGSVGKQSMAQATEINERGVYTIQRTVDKNPTVEDSLSLKMTSRNDERDGDDVGVTSKMSLADLHDLQSKIMLIAGEKESGKHVTLFVDVLNAMESLAVTFVNLVNAGCMLFNEWRMEVANQTTEGDPEFLVKIYFLNDSDAISTKCKFDQIELVTTVMGDILERWMKQLNSDRIKYYYLNEYSIHQIIFLCKTLANDRETKYPDQVYILLSRIKKNSTFAEIKELLSDATKVADSDEEIIPKSGEGVEELNRVDLMKKMTRLLVNEDGIDENLAKAAVQAKGYKDKDECIDWILLNYDLKDEIEQLKEEFDQEIGFSHQDNKVHAYGSVVHDRSHRTIQEVMAILQKEAVSSDGQSITASILTVYTKYSRSTASLTLRDCLSVRHLGKFLTALGERKKVLNIQKDLERSLPPPLKKRQPNLIVCPEQDMLSVVFSLYMHSSQAPLPGTSEVLLCHENTTANEMKRFFRRAMGKCDSNGNPLFCLVFAHKLTHNVAEAAEKIFDTLSKDDINPSYQLAVLTSSEKHYLTTCFDQFLSDVKLIEHNDNKISDYLRKHLTVNIKEVNRSAACVEKRSSSVKVVYSKRSGVGKSLHVKRLKQYLESRMHKDSNYHITTVRFMQKKCDVDLFIDTVYQEERSVLNADTHLIHIDLTPAVKIGVDRFTFSLLILGGVEDSNGRVWTKNPNHLYVVEVTEFQSQKQGVYCHSMLPLLPKVRCLSPLEETKVGKADEEVVGMDESELESDAFQRPFQYLLRHDNHEALDNFTYDCEHRNHDKELCINIYCKYLSIPDPSWAQIHYFSRFLNIQLENCERSIFCNTEAAPELKGLKAFAIQFMILMAQDFATPSLHISDESEDDSSRDYFEGYKKRRKWEETSHPYVFFNDDSASMTFININIDKDGNLVNKLKKIELENVVAIKALVPNLQAQGVPIGVDFDDLTRKEKLKQICKFMGVPITECSIAKDLMLIVQNGILSDGCVQYNDEDTQRLQVVSPEDMRIFNQIKRGNSAVMGAEFEEKERVLKHIALKLQLQDSFTQTDVPDPDPTYELTTDNVLKIFAIYMRFRCGIPVIIMGETGCGKTRMIEFISNLKRATVEHTAMDGLVDSAVEPKNMITLKVHGGVTVKDIQESIYQAKELANRNMQNIPTILFYDEANTTEAIYAIKEAVCDLEVGGKTFSDSHLQIVAACNPYKKLSQKVIDKLESSGLGYRVRKSKAEDKFGSLPMRTLVYRVVPLPPSMRPFVWDFGQLACETEKIYIEQMTKKLSSRLNLSMVNQRIICNVLSDVQSYMRDQGGECRYVSLRDVERCMKAYEWFYTKRDWLYKEIECVHSTNWPNYRLNGCSNMDPNIRTLIQISGLCYHASLDNREDFREMLSRSLEKFGGFSLRQSDILKELLACQAVIVSDMKKEKYVALNEALMENVYMMTLCVDMKIPLFLIGKPGSSKSMAKTLVSENMRGDNSQGSIFRKLKQVQVVSFQCSALTHASGIIGVFKQCIKLQSGHRQDTFAAAVVLDEIGLAEDSPNMPLKVLHSLLENGTTTCESLRKTSSECKVAFVGISNWSLDPAKMNRGIFVTRNKPNKTDMEKTTEAIFSDDTSMLRSHKRIIDALTETYLKIDEWQKNEYFGLRDFYSLMKMIKDLVGGDLTMNTVMDAVVRNFSGGRISYIEEFNQAMKSTRDLGHSAYSPMSVDKAIAKNLSSESRYLLLLANQYAAINLLQVVNKKDNMQVIFGSSFPGDRNYTEICRNINRIKLCMETGKSVIILNLTEIHESLYDALNQHYVMFGDQKYVDLALGGHRVKCRVHDQFRMIILENRDVVYDEYPTPLINRLEKHHFDSKSLLFHKQKVAVGILWKWISEFCSYNNDMVVHFEPSECFVGFHDDTVSSVVLISDDKDQDTQDYYQHTMLQTATMDSIFRLPLSNLPGNKQEIQQYYLNAQEHDTLQAFLQKELNQSSREVCLYEIVSFSNVLSEQDRKKLEDLLNLEENSVMLLSLHQFDTEQQYLRKLNEFFRRCHKKPSKFILIIQCSQAERHRQLISCARFALTNVLAQYNSAGREDESAKSVVIAAFVLSTRRKCSELNLSHNELLLQHTTDAEIVYVDELRPSVKMLKSPSSFFDLSMKAVFEKCLENDKLFDIQMLFKDCVCYAVQKLKSDNEERNLKQVSILTKLFERTEFTDAVLRKIYDMHIEQKNDEETETEDISWCVKEACNMKSLIEGGTFRKTIWLYLKRYTTKFLAHILSIIDSNDNLDVLEASLQTQKLWQKDLWLNLLNCMPFSRKGVEDDEEFKVEHSGAVPYYKFITPFSYYLHELFSEKLDAARTPGVQNRDQVFLRSVEDISKVMISARSEGGDDFVENFLSDIVHLVYCPKTTEKEREVEIVVDVIKCYVRKAMTRSGSESPPPMIYYIVHSISPFLTFLADMFEICPDLMGNAQKWRQKQDSINEECFRIHEFAFGDLIELLKRKSQSITSAEICLSWHKTTSLAIDLYNSISESVEGDIKNSFKKQWDPISFLFFLLTKLLPNKQHKEYIEVIAKQANLLSKGCRERSLQSPIFGRLFCNTLSMCLEELQLKVTLRWQDSICKTCNTKIVSPMLLPCQHVLCKKCLDISLTSDDSTCPTCSERIPRNNGGTPMTLSKDSKREIELFRQNCTSLFLTFVDQFLYAHPQVQKDQEHVNLDLLILDACVVHPHMSKRLKTNAFDLNINARCLILERLLRYSYDDLECKLNEEIRKLSNQDDRQNLAIVILNHLESQQGQMAWNAKVFSEGFQKIKNQVFCDLTMLREMAKLRMMLQNLAALLYHDDDITNELSLDIARCFDDDQSETFKLYLVKSGCFINGMEWFNKVSTRLSKELFPAFLRKAEMLDIDPWAMLGEAYNVASSELVTMTSENVLKTFKEFLSLLDDMHSFLQLTNVMCVASWILKEELIESAVSDLKPNSYTRMAKTVETIFQIAEKFKITESYKTVCILIKVMIAAASAVWNGSDMMSNFVVFFENPSAINSLFLPSMPESTYFKVPAIFREEKKNVLDEYWTDMYTCPNGHIYTIGDCTHPVWKGKCNECGATIGGDNYQPAAGNKRFVLQESSQAGYMLEQTDPPRQNMDDPCDRMTRQGVAVTRFMLHTCMLIALHEDSCLVSSFSEEHTAGSFADYLFHQLQENLNDLSQSLALNMDDTLLVMNIIFLNINLKTPQPSITSDDESESEEENGEFEMGVVSDLEGEETEAEEASGDERDPDSETLPCDWSGIDARRRWEQKFRKKYLVPVFTNIGDLLSNAWKTINESGNLCEMALYRITRDMPIQGNAPENGGVWTNPSFWKIIQRPSLPQLVQSIRDDSGGNEILQLVLNTPNLHIIKFLKVVLEVQSKFIERYQYKYDLAEVDNITFADFLNEEQHRQQADEMLHKYFTAWNESGFSTKIDGCQRTINQNSPVSMALPSNRGHGKWAKLLTESLIEVQNTFLQNCLEKAPEMRFQEVTTVDLLEHHLVVLDRERDLNPLIEMHTNYHIIADENNGTQHRISYNLSALEKEVKEKFIFRKKLVDKKSISCIQYPQDIGIGTDWRKLNDKIPQVPLTPKMTMDVDIAVRNQSQADVCEAVRIVAIAISFLSKVTKEQNCGLKQFLTKDLFLTDGHSTLVHKSIELRHTLGLYQRLTWHKAVMFAGQGVDPYKDVFAKGQQEDIDENLKQRVLEALPEINIKLLQLRINEILLKRPDYNLNWSLSEDLFPFIDDFLDQNVKKNSWYEYIPIEICYKHIAHLFRLSVQFLDEQDKM